MNQPQTTEPGFIAKGLALVASVALLVLGFMFSLVVLAVVAVAALGIGGYFWWKTRDLRKALREQAQKAREGSGGPAGANTRSGHVVEGEATVVEGEFTQVRVTLPRDASPPQQ